MKISKKLARFGLAVLAAASLYGCSKDSNPTAPIQNQAPETIINNYNVNGNTVTFSYSGSDSDGRVIGYEYTHDGTPDWIPTNVTNLPLTFTNGSHWFKVRSIDDKFLPDPTPATVSFSVNNQPTDTQNPETNITSGPTGTINVNYAQFNWTGSDDVTPANQLVYQYYLQGLESTFGPWESTISKAYSNLPENTYTFRVRSKDLTGKIDPTEATRTFTVDTQNPEFLDIIGEFPVPDVMAAQGIECSDGYLWLAGLNYIEKRPVTNPSTLTARYAISGLDMGSSSGLFDVLAVGNQLLVHAPTSTKFYFLNKSNPTIVERTVTVPASGGTGIDFTKSMEKVGDYFYFVNSVGTSAFKVDQNFNQIARYPTDYQGYFIEEISHDGTNFWAIGMNFDQGATRSRLFKLNDNFTVQSEYPIPYDVSDSPNDNAGMLEIEGDHFWTASQPENVKKIIKLYKGN